MVSLALLGILAKPATDLGKGLTEFLWPQLCFCFTYKDNVNNLRKQVEKLLARRTDVEYSVEQAQLRGDTILKEVERWMGKTTEIVSKFRSLYDDDLLFSRDTRKCCARYVLSRKAVKILQEVSNLIEEGKFEKGVSHSSASPPDTNAIPAAEFVAFESNRLAMERVMGGLRDKEVHIIGLHGMGGVGKTMLIKEVGRQAKEDGLFDRVLTIVISQKPDLARIQAQIASSLGLQFREGGNTLIRAAELSERFKRERRVLVILDDIWDALDLSKVGIPIGGNHRGCKVVITTRRENVCHEIGNMGNHTRIILLDALSEGDAWDLFRRNAGDIVNNTAIQDVARDVARECGGLPIALVTVGKALRDKNNLRVWKAARNQLRKSTSSNIEGMHDRALPCLKLSYDYLKSEEERKLFLLCSLFPEDYDISIELLVEYGIGEGLFQHVDTMEEARDRALMIVDNLKSSCLLLDGMRQDWAVSFHYAIGSVRMHDVIRDMAISIASSSSSSDLFLVKADVGLQCWPRNNSASEKYSSISLMGNPGLRELPDGLIYPRLRTLLLQECYGYEPVTMPGSFFEHMSTLRVLDLSHNIFQYPSPFLFEPLTKLRVLCIRVFYVMSTPIDLRFGALKRLEVLRLQVFQLVAFPKDIAQLVNLRLLDLSSCRFTTIPPGILSRLSQLEELYMKGSFNEWGMVVVQGGNTGEITNAGLAEINRLHRLNILHIDIARGECVPQEADFLPTLTKFRILIGSTIEDALAIENISRTPRELVLNGIVINNLPRWFKREILATTVGLKYTPRRAVNILVEFDQFGLLDCLQVLIVHACTLIQSLMNATEWNPKRSAFINLVKLYLINLSNLRNICLGQLPTSCFKNLRVLRVFNCPQLRKVMTASQAKNLQQLEELEISFNQAMEEIVEREGRGEVHETIVFPRLRTVRLLEMLNLMCFYGGDSLVECPSLEEVIVDTCPNLKTFASGLQFTPKFRRIRALIMGRGLDIDVEQPLHGQLNSALRLHFSKWVEAITSGVQSTAKPFDPRSHLFTMFGLWEGYPFVDLVYKSIEVTSRIQYVVTYENEVLVSSNGVNGKKRNTIRVNVTPTVETSAGEHQGSMGDQQNGSTPTQSVGGSSKQQGKRLIVSHGTETPILRQEESSTLRDKSRTSLSNANGTSTTQKPSGRNRLGTEQLALPVNIGTNTQSLQDGQRIPTENSNRGDTMQRPRESSPPSTNVKASIDRPGESSTLRDDDGLTNSNGNATNVVKAIVEKPGEISTLEGKEGTLLSRANNNTTMQRSGEGGTTMQSLGSSTMENNYTSAPSDATTIWEKGESSNPGANIATTAPSLRDNQRILIANTNGDSTMQRPRDSASLFTNTNATTGTQGGFQSGEDDQYSIRRCIEVLTAIDNVSDNIYLQALRMFQDPSWRQTFISLTTDRRVMWLKSLE
ncbi:disease resistance protein At4g27190-like [Macadamia integrifolia]|uniref:disease resistance protein At4g27190-like n=1 Tax=Macadamia integrifolia TaxID=60698 RepID=UPI001C4EE9BB|nr:disease resistance protein At4g27190-like [Macadamia integrifolia]